MNSSSRPAARSGRSPWPYAIAAWLILFIAGLAAWAVVAVRQDMDLVRPDYYEEEIRYQNQIDRVHRTSPLRGEMTIAHDLARREVSVRLPLAHAIGVARGVIRFYRPSDARLDFERPLALDATGAQRIESTELRAGLWEVRVSWTVAGREYYFDRKIVL